MEEKREDKKLNTHFSKMSQSEIDEYINTYVEKQIQNFSQDDLLKKGSEIKTKNKKNFILLFSLSCIFLCLAVVSFILGALVLDKFLTLGAVLTFVFIVLFIFMSTKIKFLKANEKDCVRFELEHDIKAQIKEFINIEKEIEETNKSLLALDPEYIDGKKIKTVQIVDSYTTYSDKLHAVLNYQEIIQHRVYKFLVTFEDDTTSLYTTEEGTNVYNKLIVHINKKISKTGTSSSPKSSADELAKYKNLLDDGAITQEEYEQKKKELLK